MHTALAVLVKLLAVMTAAGAVMAFRKSRKAGMGLVLQHTRWRQVALASLYYPAALAAVVATLALVATSDGWRSVRLAVILGGGLFAILWPFYFLTRALFAKIAFDAMHSHRSFAEQRKLTFDRVGPEFREGSESEVRQSCAAVHIAEGHWLALVGVASGSVGERGFAQKTRLERPVAVDVSEPEVWNLKPIGGLLGRALSRHSRELAALGPRLSYLRLEPRRLVLMGAPNRSREQVAELVDFAEVLAASIDELCASAENLVGKRT